jgi:2-haloacid dehalogenase
MKRHKDFWQVTEDSLDKSINAFNIDKSMRNELLDLYKILNTFPEDYPKIKKLKEKKYKLAILSNGTPALLNDLVKRNNLEGQVFHLKEY